MLVFVLINFNLFQVSHPKYEFEEEKFTIQENKTTLLNITLNLQVNKKISLNIAPNLQVNNTA